MKNTETSDKNPFDAFVDTIWEMWESLLSTAPKVLVWLFLLLIGWIIFKLISKGIVAILSKTGLDGVAENFGISDMLKRIGVTSSFSTLLGKILFFVLMIQFTMISSERFELNWLTQPLESAMEFFPKLITASIILIVGYILSDLIKNALFNGAERMGLDYAKSLSNLLFGFLLLLTVILAVRELGIETSILEDTVKIGMVGVALAFSLCLGLGLHHMARNVVSGVYARDLYREGTQVEYDGELTDVIGVGSVTTKLLKNDGSFVMVPNQQLVSEVTRGREGGINS